MLTLSMIIITSDSQNVPPTILAVMMSLRHLRKGEDEGCDVNYFSC